MKWSDSWDYTCTDSRVKFDGPYVFHPTSIMEPLPLEILLYILDLLAAGDDGDIKSLQILSQTCKSMVPLCRKHLFSSLRLHTRLDSERFSDLLSRIPDIARYVTSLNYAVYDSPIYDHELNILDILKEHSLQSIELLSPLGFIRDWRKFPESIRSSLVCLIQLPTVTHLSIKSFKGFPATALSRCSNLIDLRLAKLRLEIAPPSPEVNQVISRSKIPTPVSLYTRPGAYNGLTVLLNSASLHAGGPVVDFSRLQKADFNVDRPGDIGHISELIKATTRLQYIYIGSE
jgi:hypothetical protein